MAKLTAKARNALPDSAFAGPDRSYPINNPSHARNALSRAAHNASPEERAGIKRKVKARYPSIKVSARGGVVHGEGEAPKARGDRARRGR